jgi:L-amino acid N-acyltransferase YncA
MGPIEGGRRDGESKTAKYAKYANGEKECEHRTANSAVAGSGTLHSFLNLVQATASCPLKISKMKRNSNGKRINPLPTTDRASVTLRAAAGGDLTAINHIYNHYVLHSTCTYQETPEPLAGRRQWFAHHGVKHPIIVAEIDGRVVGWGSLSAYHARSAYRNTVENSIYIHHDYHRRGIGSLLLKELITRARDLGHRTIIAGIDADQAGSIALHVNFHFEKAGHLKQVGFKFGRWLDVVYMQLML